MLNAFQSKIKSQFITEYFDIQPKLNSFLAVTGSLLDLWRGRPHSRLCGADSPGLLSSQVGPAHCWGRRPGLSAGEGGDGESLHRGGATLPPAGGPPVRRGALPGGLRCGHCGQQGGRLQHCPVPGAQSLSSRKHR